MRLDPVGALFSIPSMVYFVIDLQLGGWAYEWSNLRLVVLLVAFGLTAVAFGVAQVMMPGSASLPMRVITQRTMLAGTGFMVFLEVSMFPCIYYLPLWCRSCCANTSRGSKKLTHLSPNRQGS